MNKVTKQHYKVLLYNRSPQLLANLFLFAEKYLRENAKFTDVVEEIRNFWSGSLSCSGTTGSLLNFHFEDVQLLCFLFSLLFSPNFWLKISQSSSAVSLSSS